MFLWICSLYIAIYTWVNLLAGEGRGKKLNNSPFCSFVELYIKLNQSGPWSPIQYTKTCIGNQIKTYLNNQLLNYNLYNKGHLPLIRCCTP